MFDKQTIFLLALQQLKAMAVQWNEEARRRWDLAVANWKLNAAWAQGNNRSLPDKPSGPSELMTIEVPEGSIEQDQIMIKFGPSLVSDLPCELEPVVASDKPKGVVAVGYDYGNVFAALPNDTAENDTIVQHVRKNGQPVTLRKVYHPRGTMGAVFSDHNFYEVVN